MDRDPRIKSCRELDHKYDEEEYYCVNQCPAREDCKLFCLVQRRLDEQIRKAAL